MASFSENSSDVVGGDVGLGPKSETETLSVADLLSARWSRRRTSAPDGGQRFYCTRQGAIVLVTTGMVGANLTLTTPEGEFTASEQPGLLAKLQVSATKIKH